MYRRTLNKNNNLLFGRWIKEVAHRAGSLAPEHHAAADSISTAREPQPDQCPECGDIFEEVLLFGVGSSEGIGANVSTEMETQARKIYSFR
jgi:hypothetical protein